VEAAQYFARSDSTTRTRLTIVGGVVLLVAALFDFRFYFLEYTPARRFSDANTEVAQNLGRFLQAEGLDQGAQVYFSGMPRMGWRSIETLPYLVPGDTFTDIGEPLAAPPTWAAEPPTVFVFLPENLGDLAWVERAYPGGEIVVRTAKGDRDLYTAYLLR